MRQFRGDARMRPSSFRFRVEIFLAGNDPGPRDRLHIFNQCVPSPEGYGLSGVQTKI